MARHLLPIVALLFSTAFLLAGNGMHSLVLPLRGSAEGFSTPALGLIGTGWAIGFVAGCLSAPMVVRRVGHIRAFATSAACAAIIFLLNGIFVDPVSWMLLRIGSGFFLAGAFMIIESWLNERATNESRGTVFAIYLMVTYLAITVGQLGVAAGDPRTPTLFMVGAIMFCLAVLPTALSTAASPMPLKRAKLDIRGLIANSPVASLTVLLVGVINGAFGTLGAVWGTRIGLSTSIIAIMMSITVVSGALTQIPAGRLSDRTDRRYVIAGTAIAASLAGIVIAVLGPTDPATVLVLVALYGGLTYPIYGLAVAHANDYANPGTFVAVSGGLLLLYGFGTIIGPIAASVAMSTAGPAALFLVTSASHAAIAGYAIFRSFRRAPVAESAREAYRSVPSSRGLTPETVAMDPRAEETPKTDLDDYVAAK